MIKRGTCIFFLLIAGIIFPQANNYPFYSVRSIDINDVNVSVTNVGSGYGMSMWNVPPAPQELLYDYGPFFVAKSDIGIVWSQNAWESHYAPGPLNEGQSIWGTLPEGSDSLRVYKINKSDSFSANRDLSTWPIELGAPSDENLPLCFADQSAWCVYNALDSNKFKATNDWPKYGLEIQQNIYAYGADHPDIGVNFLDEVVFFEYTFINKTGYTLDSVFTGIWTDIDFTELRRDEFAVDTINQLGYHWSNFFKTYGTTDTTYEPAAGFVQLYGPLFPDEGGAATFSGETRTGYRNLPISAFHGVADDSTPPDDYFSIAYTEEAAFNMAKGLNKQGAQVTDMITGEVTKFPWSSDPRLLSGWPNHDSGGGMGFYLFTGPFAMEPGDTNWAMYAFIPVQGGGPVQSISEIKRRAEVLRAIDYNSLVTKTRITLVGNIEEQSEVTTPKQYSLQQNYPNPFNNETIVTFSIPESEDVKIEIINLLGQKIKEISMIGASYGKNEVSLSMDGFNSGIYFYKIITKTFTQTKKMVYLK